MLSTKLGLQPWCPVPFRNRAGKGLRHQMNLLQPVCQRNLASWSQNEDFLRVCCKKSWYVWHHFDIWYLLVSDILSMKSDEPFWESCSGACLEFTRLWCQNEACRCWTLRRFPKAFWHVNRAMPATPIYSAIRVLKAVWIRACAMALSNLRNWSVWRVAHFSESLICRWDPSDKESPGSVSRKT